MKIGKWLIIAKDRLPHLEKAHKLARCMTEEQIEDVLRGKAHFHRNPRKKLSAVGGECGVNFETRER